jgi:uncharacterized protein
MKRKLPALTPDNTPFWQGGAQGLLNMCHCAACSRFFHPPGPVCPHCQSQSVGPRAVRGLGKVVSYTVNHQAWAPDLQVPFVVAIVELQEQTGLRFVSNIVGCAPASVAIGMAVQVRFEHVEDVWIPLFEPAVVAEASTRSAA